MYCTEILISKKIKIDINNVQFSHDYDNIFCNLFKKPCDLCLSLLLGCRLSRRVELSCLADKEDVLRALCLELCFPLICRLALGMSSSWPFELNRPLAEVFISLMSPRSVSDFLREEALFECDGTVRWVVDRALWIFVLWFEWTVRWFWGVPKSDLCTSNTGDTVGVHWSSMCVCTP